MGIHLFSIIANFIKTMYNKSKITERSKNMKVAQVGYGHDGRGLGATKGNNPDGYTYLVNDNVRKGAVLTVTAFNIKAQKDVITTAQVRHTQKNFGTKTGQTVAEQMGKAGVDADEIKTGYTGKDLGVTSPREEGTGRFRPQAETGHHEGKKYIPSEMEQARRDALAKGQPRIDGDKPDSPSESQVKETYETYASKFMTEQEDGEEDE